MPARNQTAGSTFFAGTRTQQSGIVSITGIDCTAEECAGLAEAMRRLEVLPVEMDKLPDDPRHAFATLMVVAHRTLLTRARFHYPEAAEPLFRGNDEKVVRFAVPKVTLHGNLASELLVELMTAANAARQHPQTIDGWIAETHQRLSAIPRPGPNNFHFARAAHEMELPLFEWRAGQFQVGTGAGATVLMGSITHQTTAMGVNIAREKAACKGVLAKAGLPVATGGVATQLPAAMKLAEELGFPVVVKPANADGGKGVASDIRTPAELERAYAAASKFGKRIIVEKHIDGLDYRLLFCHDELLLAIERSPGGVTGNGRDTVAALVAALNAQPNRGPGPETEFYSIELDDEAAVMLQRNGMTLDTIPGEGQFVQLRRAANYALGGTVRKVDDIIHPDNLALAKRAKDLLRLDLAGIDLMLPDITRSWVETGGVVIEVNAQPFIGEPIRVDFHRYILERLLSDGGRVPTVLVVGDIDRATLDDLSTAIPGLAICDGEGAHRDGARLSAKGASWLQASQAMLLEPATQAALIVCPEEVRSASPIDRYDAALMLRHADGAKPAADKAAEPLDGELLLEVVEEPLPEDLRMLLSRAGRVHAVSDAGQWLSASGIESVPLAEGGIAQLLKKLLSR